MKNFEEKIWILNEHREGILDEDGLQMSLKQFVKLESESDPDFFRWLFDEEFENDFDLSLSKDQKEEYEQWLNTL